MIRTRAARPQPMPPGNRAATAHMPARDRAYHDLRYRILTGRLPPGTTLLETELGALLSLSRTPVREAAIRLAEEGLVSIRPRRGITVRELTVPDLVEVLDVFSALEIRAVALVAERGLSASEDAHLSSFLDRMERCTKNDDIATWSALDDDFHATLVGLCGNARLQRTMGEYWGQHFRARTIIVPLRPRPTQSDIEHRAILSAVRAGDKDRARLAHLRHRERADAQMIALLRQNCGGEPDTQITKETL